MCGALHKGSCEQAHAFADHASSLGVRAEVSEDERTHSEINRDLGLPSSYTERVDAFVESVSR